LKLRQVREQVNKNAPELLEELFELPNFIIGTDADLRLIVTTDDACSASTLCCVKQIAGSPAAWSSYRKIHGWT
jgi:hypothetical protein